ncbi:UPF0481-like protein [Cinnamomum micranthum f. kanehirae]|uniref:UPF0481-like protein n=1 Tax=Cinnamomum micranthum f. kanehirae TaxID=337451 RepID=A0A443N834_9MAGN|nr:UPF0481-like protein [Cinnamomum micranthum f. kanehirae]
MATGECWIKVDEDPPNGEWLIKLINDEQDQRMSLTPSKITQIQNVATTLRDAEWNKGCFDPLVVSFGPYHHGKDGLKPMESCKGVAAHWFLSLATANPPQDHQQIRMKEASPVTSSTFFDPNSLAAMMELKPQGKLAIAMAITRFVRSWSSRHKASRGCEGASIQENSHQLHWW